MRSFATWVGRGLGAALTLVLAVVIVVGLFGLGYSGGIGDNYSDLEDLDAPRPFNLVITDAGGGEVSLEGDDVDVLSRGSRWGLDYPGGYGRVGDATGSNRETVTRSFEAVAGPDPVPGSAGEDDR